MPVDYAKARRYLARRDPVIAAIITRQGPCGLARSQRSDSFMTLVKAIVNQQLSTKAAATIYGRLLGLFPAGRTPAAAEVAAVPRARLRNVGLSRAKADYVRDLAAKVATGAVRLDTLDSFSDEQVIDTLIEIKGIGRWSAEMLLIFHLGRPDVLPVGDLGIARAIQKAYRLRKPPTPARMFTIAEPWRPYRSVASWYLWASLRKPT